MIPTPGDVDVVMDAGGFWDLGVVGFDHFFIFASHNPILPETYNTHFAVAKLARRLDQWGQLHGQLVSLFQARSMDALMLGGFFYPADSGLLIGFFVRAAPKPIVATLVDPETAARKQMETHDRLLLLLEAQLPGVLARYEARGAELHHLRESSSAQLDQFTRRLKAGWQNYIAGRVVPYRGR